MSCSASQLVLTTVRYKGDIPVSTQDIESMDSNLRTSYDSLAGFAAGKTQYIQRYDETGSCAVSNFRFSDVEQDGAANLYDAGSTDDGEFYDHSDDYVAKKNAATDVTAGAEVRANVRATQ